MSTTTAAVGVIAAGLLVLSGGTASAQGLPGVSSSALDAATLDPAALIGSAEVPGGYLGSAGEVLPGSVTGSLPGYASGPLGSVATAVCNAGSVAGVAGIGLPAEVDPACMVVPALARSGDYFGRGDLDGSVGALIGGVPYVGSALSRVVPSHSAADAARDAMGRIPADSGELVGQFPVNAVAGQLPSS